MNFQKLKNVALIAIMLFTAELTFASGPFLEPGISYQEGRGHMDFPAPFSNSTASVRGLGALLRAGVHITDIIFLGADGRYSRPWVRNENFSAKATDYNWGAVLGVQTPTPVALRVWGTYIFDGGLDPEEDRGFDIKYTRASGYRYGVGFKILLASLNLEYQNIKYDTAMLQSIGPFSTNTTFNNLHPRNKSVILSVSFPLFF